MGSEFVSEGGVGAVGARVRTRRRWPWIAAGTVLVLVVLAAAWWFLWLPAWRPDLDPGERYGIDVSTHQGSIDWMRVAHDHITFAYIKATEGADHVDDRFAANWEGAGSAGLDRGAYHFFTLCTPGAAQATNFLATAPRETYALAPAVDLELAGNCGQRPDPETVRRELRTFIDAVESAWGQPVVLYVGEDFERRYHVQSRLGRLLWVQRFLLRPDTDGWAVWQAQGFASVDGVAGDVDLDVMTHAQPVSAVLLSGVPASRGTY